MKLAKKILIGALFAPLVASASGEALKLDPAPKEKFTDVVALQRGAKVFVNYCLNCHSASYMRYNRLKDLGLTETQIKDNLLFTADKVGELMKVGMQRADATQWFGAAPPDLSVIARARASGDGSGADWLYTYLRGFYRDDSRPTGWNNTVFHNVGMPHVLYELQGEQVAKHTKVVDAHGHESEQVTLEQGKAGKMSKAEYDSMVGDLVAFLVYMGEPAAESRKQLGLIVILGLAVLAALSYLLKREFWKDVH